MNTDTSPGRARDRSGRIPEATKNRLHAFRASGEQNHTAFLRNADIYASRSGLLSFVNNNLPRYAEMPDIFRWGYETLGTLIVGFCLWVSAKASEEKIDDLFFLARDMNLFLQAYRILHGAGKTHYLEISRKSLRREYVKTEKELTAVYHTMKRGRYSLAETLASIDMEVPEELSVFADRPLRNLSQGQYEILNRCVLDNVNRDSLHGREYLKQQGATCPGKCAIVDIGWHGTTQNMLETICGKPFLGLYFGSTKRSEFADMDSRGYWFDEQDETCANDKLAIIYILETMLFPEIGTTVAYKRDEEGKVVPVYDNFISPHFSNIKSFQNGAMQMIQDLAGARLTLGEVDAKEAAAAYERFAFCPTRQQAKALCDLQYEDGSVSPMAEVRPWRTYLAHPHTLLADYKKARWKEGFLRLLLPWLPCPHFWVCLIKQAKRQEK